MFLNAGIQPLRYRNEEKNASAGTSRKRKKGPSPVPECYASGRSYREDAGIPMPPPSASMPMPSYDSERVNTASLKNIKIIGYNQCEKEKVVLR
jgi:hypothetical protein